MSDTNFTIQCGLAPDEAIRVIRALGNSSDPPSRSQLAGDGLTIWDLSRRDRIILAARSGWARRTISSVVAGRVHPSASGSYFVENIRLSGGMRAFASSALIFLVFFWSIISIHPDGHLVHGRGGLPPILSGPLAVLGSLAFVALFVVERRASRRDSARLVNVISVLLLTTCEQEPAGG